jgi:hypothetical protein
MCLSIFVFLFFLEEFDFLAYGTNTKADARGVGGIGWNADVGGLHCNLVARFADGFDAIVHVIHREREVTERALRENVIGVGEDLHHAAANVDHSAGQTLVGAPFAHDGHTEKGVIKVYGFFKMCHAVALDGNVVNALCQTFHNSLLLGAKIWFFQPRQVIGFIVPQIKRVVKEKETLKGGDSL